MKSLHTIEPWVSRGTSDQWGGLCWIAILGGRGCELREKFQSERSVWWWIKISRSLAICKEFLGKWKPLRFFGDLCRNCFVWIRFDQQTAQLDVPYSFSPSSILHPNNRGTYAAVVKCHQTSQSLPKHSRLEPKMMRFVGWKEQTRGELNGVTLAIPPKWLHDASWCWFLCPCPVGIIKCLPISFLRCLPFRNWVASRVSTKKTRTAWPWTPFKFSDP